MITLYLNHFRGFEDTFIPLDDVSFLVGENSTGKTSVLTAVRVLWSNAVWIDGRFRVNDEVVGGFNDFASNGDKWFQVGYFRHEPGEKTGYDAALLTFTGRGSDVPLTLDVRLLSSHTELHFHVDQEVRYDKREEAESIEAAFRAWVKVDPWLAEGSSLLKTSPSAYGPLGITGALETQESNLYYEQMDAFDRAREAQDEAMDRWQKARREGSQEPKPTLPPLPARPEHPGRYPPTTLGFMAHIEWLAPIRAKPRRSYDSVIEAYSPEGDHIPWRLHDLPDRSKLRQDLREYGRRSGLYDDVETRKFGDAEDAPFELRVRFGGRTPNLINVGYGVSQVLPVMTTVLDPKLQGAWFALQQPEVHLHPRAQAALGETLFEMALSPHDKRFLVETHSDYVIDRFCYRMRKAHKNKEQALRAQVLFFERVGDKNVVHRIPFAPDGEYPEDQPKAFREFFLAEQLQNLGY